MRGEHFENLTRGTWVSAVALRNPPTNYNGDTVQPDFNGSPIEVMATSFPFVVGRDAHGRMVTFDFRELVVTEVSRTYVRAVAEGMQACGKKVRMVAPARRKRREKPDPGVCPRCGDRLVQRLLKARDGWRLHCRQCGFDGGECAVSQ